MSDREDPNIVHNEKQRQFVICRDGGKATLSYEYINNNTVDLQHTEVSDQLRGKGYGDLLANAALAFASRNKLRVKLSCSFLNHYFVKNALSKEQYRIVNR